MSEKPKDEAAAEQLALALKRVLSGTRTERVAGTAYVQSVFAQTAGQALINLLKSKNIISDKEIERVLAEAYNERFKQLSGASGAIVTVPPLVRPQ